MFTFPRVYHSGFSHGFNCTEAVNVISSHWISSYTDAILDYEKAGYYKKPSYSLEWLLTTIIQKLDKGKFDKNTLKQIKSEWVKLVTQEKQYREKMKLLYEDLLVVKEISNKNVKYDRYICRVCSNYPYFSSISCMKCFKTGCIRHITICTCVKQKMTLL